MKCATCGCKKVKYLVMTAIGQKAFCGEECYCEYMDFDYHGEGHYNLNEYDEKDVENFE